MDLTPEEQTCLSHMFDDAMSTESSSSAKHYAANWPAWTSLLLKLNLIDQGGHDEMVAEGPYIESAVQPEAADPAFAKEDAEDEAMEQAVANAQFKLLKRIKATESEGEYDLVQITEGQNTRVVRFAFDSGDSLGAVEIETAEGAPEESMKSVFSEALVNALWTTEYLPSFSSLSASRRKSPYKRAKQADPNDASWMAKLKWTNRL